MHSNTPARRRHLRTWIPGKGNAELQPCSNTGIKKKLLDLASNDYLGLSRHPELIKAAQTTMNSEGLGAGGSRLLTGSRPIHEALEKAMAHWLKRERVLLFPSGFQANLAAVMALANRNTTVLADRLIHHSLLIGVKASGAKLQRYAHNDINDLRRLLKLNHNKQTLVITESLFSMEGSSPPLDKISSLCEEYDAKLIVDEAHALGVIGEKSRGLSYGLSGALTLISGTFGKAFGSGGAFLASNASMGDHLLQSSGAFRYTTALAPPLAASALAALNLIQANPQWGEELQERSSRWRERLAKEGWAKPPGNGPILSLIVGSDQTALDLQRQLEDEGLLCIAIRPPTVPEGTSRLRIVLRKDLPDKALEKLVKVLNKK